uniref:Uncharacterized protein n=1 Tax=Alexandrium monilatum TaxID=311494 RepID=A0A7S4QIH2_9DINO|mmetsp:Transcript_90192/g.269084  ORF Transcript_90192/g.269084 Transcript_90192/m.269084 type:complete len:498 (+) Transcript_90192:93-1586(+)
MSPLPPRSRTVTLAWTALRPQVVRAASARRPLLHAPAVRAPNAAYSAGRRGFSTSSESRPAALLERAVRELVREQCAAAGEHRAPGEVASGTADLERAIEARVREAISPLSEELRTRLASLEQQPPHAQQDVGALVREALEPFREELGAKVSEESARKLAEAASEEAIRPLRAELTVAASSLEAVATAKTEEAFAPLRKVLEGKASGEEVQAAAKREAAEVAAELRKEVAGLLQEALQPLSEEVKSKLNVEEAPAKIEEALEKSLQASKQAIMADVHRVIGEQLQEAAKRSREELQGKADAEGTRQALAQLREDVQSSLQQPREVPEAALRQAASMGAGEALAPLREELRVELQQLRAPQAALEQCVEELQRRVEEQSAARPEVDARVREELQQQLSAGAFRHQLKELACEALQPTQATQEAVDALQAEVATLREELAALQQRVSRPEEVTQPAPPRHPLIRGMRVTAQVLAGGAALLVALGIWSEQQKRFTPKTKA